MDHRTCIVVALACALIACGTETPSSSDAVHASTQVSFGEPVPDLSFDGVDADGVAGRLRLRDYRGQEALLVVISGGSWCGTCRWTTQGRVSAVPDVLQHRIRRLDLVLGDRDNGEPDALAAQEYRNASEDLDQVGVAADPQDVFASLFADRDAPLPRFVLLTGAELRVADVLANPAPRELQARLRSALGDPPAAGAAETLVDGFFREHEWALLQETVVPAAPPMDPSNAVADSPAAAALGRDLFFDAKLSPGGKIACASCHRLDMAMSDGLPRARGVAEGDRRSPSITLSAHARWHFWDGRADSGWAQALAPFEDAREFASSRVHVARRVLTGHADAYASAFPSAAVADPTGWPAAGKPGEPAYDALPEQERARITQVFVNAGKAIAAWQRTIRVLPNALDRYMAGDFGALDEAQKYGLQLFVRTGCMQCHWGPRLTDDAFHALGLVTTRQDGKADDGRAGGIQAWMNSEFRRDGAWSDAHASGRRTGPIAQRLSGQFKTPPLRGVADGAFFGHGGSFDALGSVTEFYGGSGPHAASAHALAGRESWLTTFGETEQWGLVPFLRVLTAQPTLE
ncbi:MAG: cytochrome c peroxidase [Polyangiaceae bacterium]